MQESINWGRTDGTVYSLTVSLNREVNQERKNIPLVQVEIYVPALGPKAEILHFHMSCYKP